MAKQQKVTGISNFTKLVERLPDTVNKNTWNMAQMLKAELARQNPVDRSPRADNIVSSKRWTISLTNPGDFSQEDDSFGAVYVKLPSTIKKLNEVWVYSRGIPYMAKLNRGHSPQAARGWIDRAIDMVVGKFNAQRKL